MASLTQNTDPTRKAEIVESVRPVIHEFHHQDSMFGNTFQPKSHFIVHPDWVSEGKNAPKATPMERPPWSWEQPRYRQNVQYPITYMTPRYSKEEKKDPMVPYQPSWVTYHLPGGGRSAAVSQGPTQPFPEVQMNKWEVSAPPPTTTREQRERFHWHLHY